MAGPAPSLLQFATHLNCRSRVSSRKGQLRRVGQSVASLLLPSGRSCQVELPFARGRGSFEIAAAVRMNELCIADSGNDVDG
jgi:hypothetical protein